MVNVLRGGGIPLLAHQGGWDEILLVLAPIAVVGALLWVARRRVTRDSVDADDVGADRT
jgi:cyanate permease